MLSYRNLKIRIEEGLFGFRHGSIHLEVKIFGHRGESEKKQCREEIRTIQMNGKIEKLQMMQLPALISFLWLQLERPRDLLYGEQSLFTNQLK